MNNKKNTREIMKTKDTERQGLPSCSSLARLALCPHSLRYDVEGVETTSDMAERGNRIHQYLAYQNILLNEEETKLMLACKRIVTEVASIWAGEDKFEELMKEERCFFFEGDNALFSGKPDLVLGKSDEDGFHLLIIDYKTGPLESESTQINHQLRGLALCCKQHIERNYQDCKIKSVSCAIVQPLVTSYPVIVRYSEEDIKEAEKEVIEICERTKKDLPPQANSYCRYCKGFAECKKPLEVVQTITTPATAFSSKLKQMNPEERSKLYFTAKLASKVAKEIEESCYELLKNGEEIDGLGLKEGNTVRSFKNEGLSRVQQVIPLGDMMEAVSVSVSKLEEAFHKHQNIVNGKQSRKASNEQFNKIFGSYIVEKKQKERIVKK